MVKEIPPSPGSRAVRFMQLLSADLHPVDAAVTATAIAPQAGQATLSDRVAALELEVSALKEILESLRKELGHS
jgi:uncharacterized protein YceH (UPF0502 family)